MASGEGLDTSRSLSVRVPIAPRSAAGGEIVEVGIERTSLEQIYFDVMGVRPGADGIEPG